MLQVQLKADINLAFSYLKHQQENIETGNETPALVCQGQIFNFDLISKICFKFN